MKKFKLFGALMLLLPALASCDGLSQLITAEEQKEETKVETPTESPVEEEVKTEDEQPKKEEKEKQEDKEVVVFKVSWYNEGKLITTTDVEENGVPVFNGTLPTKQSTSTVKYTFIGWNTDSEATTALKELPKVTKDLELHAIFSSEQIVIKYRVTFYNGSTKLHSTDVLPGNHSISSLYGKANPTKESTAQYSYTFKGWSNSTSAKTDDTISPNISSSVNITADMDIYAVYSKNERLYSVVFMNGNTTVLSYTRKYGETPTYVGHTPKKDDDENYSYTFIGWNTDDKATTALKELPKVTGPLTFHAIYSKSEKPKDMTALLNDKRYLTSQGVGYTYLDYSLNTKYKSWASLLSEGYINAQADSKNITLISNRLDDLGKGVLEIPRFEGYIKGNDIGRNGSGGKGIFGDNKLLDGIILNEIGNKSFTYGIINGNESVRTFKTKNNSGYCIETLDNSCLSFCKNLETFEFDCNLLNVGDYAFSGCTSLKNLDFSSRNSINFGNYAFNDCTSLASCVLPSGLTSISEGLFNNCTSLKSLPIPSGVTIINQKAYRNTSSANETLTISSGMKRIYNNAFEGSGIKSITNNSTAELQGTNQFAECKNLTTVSGSGNFTNGLSPFCFYNCTSLSSFPFSKHTFSVGYESCFENTALTSVDFSSSSNCKAVGKNMFKNCKNLTTVKLNTNITKIGESAFEGCTNLTSITNLNIGSKGSIETNSFKNCSKLSSVSTASFTNSYLHPYAFEGSAIQNATITYTDFMSSGYLSTAEGFFKNCKNLKEVTINDNAGSIIPKEFFYGCTALEKLTLTAGWSDSAVYSGNDCNTIILKENSFYNCTNLKTVVFNGTVEQYLNPIISEKDKSTKTFTNSYFSVVTNSNLNVQCKKGFYKEDKSGSKSITITKSNYQSYINKM